MTIRSKYSVLIRALTEEDGGGWIAVVPDLPGCASDGETQTHALENVQDAIETWLDTARRHGYPIPAPDNFVSVAFPQTLPDEVKRQAEDMARQIEGLSSADPPDQALVHAIYAQLARSTIQRAHL